MFFLNLLESGPSYLFSLSPLVLRQKLSCGYCYCLVMPYPFLEIV
jgi:hypothetical protein